MKEAAPETGKPTTIRLDPQVRSRVEVFRKDRRQSMAAAVNYLVELGLDAAYRQETIRHIEAVAPADNH